MTRLHRGHGPCLDPEPMTGLVTVDGRTFPLEDVRIEARATAGLARTTLRQRYTNPFGEALEVVYTLPLPADGAVIAYTIRIGEKTIVGEVEPREKAEQEYRKALEQGRTAGLLDQERADTFTQTLGNIPPRTPVEVMIDVLHPLLFHAPAAEAAARWEYRFPTVVGVRYQGDPGRVSDRNRLDVERADSVGAPVWLDLDVRIDDGPANIIRPQSVSHGIVVEGPSDGGGSEREGEVGGSSRVRLREPSRLDRDVTIAWTAASSGATSAEPNTRLTEGRGLPGDPGRYALVTVTPPGQSHEIAAPRDLTILIDASGSMSGEPLDLVKAFVHRILTSLQPQDTLQMLAFASRTQPLIDPASPATPECVDRALRALVQLQAGGGTEMAAALREALVPLRADAQRQVLLLSDGYIGFESEVVREVLANLPTGARLHVVGVGSAPNRTLTHCASRAGRGTEQILESGDDVDAAADRMLAGTVAPALLNVRVTGTAVTTVVPERPADVYAGRPAILAVELRPGGGTLRAEALRAGSMEPWMSEVLVVNAEPELAGEAIPAGAYFGREAVEDQEMHLAAAGGEGRDSGAAILRCIETLGMRHRIATRETSLVAIAEEPSVDPREPRVRMRLPVELPAGVSAEGVGLARRFSGAPSRASRKGDGHGFMDVSYAVAQGHSVAFPPMFELPCDARLLRIENDLLIVEIKSPDPTLHLLRPDGEVIVRFNDGSVFMARVDLQLSTAGVPHRKGVTLQLVLRSAEGRPWLTGRPIAIEWKRSGAMYMVLVAGSKR